MILFFNVMTLTSKRCLGMCSVLFLSLGVFAAEPVGHAVVVIGSVNIESTKGEDVDIRRLNSNDEIFLGDIITTAADGLVKLLLRDDSVLKISPDTELAISAMIAGPGEEGDSTVDLLKGRLRSVIGDKLSAESRYSVNTPVAVAGVRGTDFEVVHLLVEGKWMTGVRSFDGEVSFEDRAGQTPVLILPNQYSLVIEDKPASAPVGINENQSLMDLLLSDGRDQTGLDEPATESMAESIDPLESFDESLDEAQIIHSLIGLEDISIETLEIMIEEIAIQTPPVVVLIEQQEEEISQPQVDILDTSIDNGTSIDIDINIPLPK